MAAIASAAILVSEYSTHPFGNNTLVLPAVTVPEGKKVSSQDLVEALGHDMVRIPAMLVPKGGAPPGYPYACFGGTASASSTGGMAWRTGASRGDAGMRSAEDGPGGADDNRPVSLPPTPALAQEYGDPVRTAIAAPHGARTVPTDMDGTNSPAQPSGYAGGAGLSTPGGARANSPATEPDAASAELAPETSGPSNREIQIAAADSQSDAVARQPAVRRGQPETAVRSPKGDDPLTYDQMKALVAANNHSGQSDELIIAIACKESRFDPNAQNPSTTAGGLLGLTGPAIADLRMQTRGQGNIDKYDPVQDIDAGSRYLALLIQRSNRSVSQALARYGTGPRYATDAMNAARALQAGPANPMQVLQQYIGPR